MSSAKTTHIVHSLPPIYDGDCRVLINGSMLSPKSREFSLYYGHPQNRFWRVICALWGDSVPETNEEKHDYVLAHKIALWNVIAECDIKGASDATIKNVIPNDMNEIIGSSNVSAIFNLGRVADSLFMKYCKPNIKIPVISKCLPSTSPANAKWSFEALVSEFQVLKEYTDV